MDDKERNRLIKALRLKRREATASKEAAITYLIEVGILTKTGKLKAGYSNLCIPSTQA